MTSRSLIRVAPDGSRTTIASAELPRPGGLAIDCGKHKGHWAHGKDRGGKKKGKNEVFYVSINSSSIGSGQVLRIEP
jgi:hypothetical protein